MPSNVPRGLHDRTVTNTGPDAGRHARPLEAWFTPFGLVNGAAVGLAPILLPVVAVRYGVAHVGLVMGAFNLGMFAAPAVGSVADRRHMHRSLAAGCAAASALSLWLFPLAGASVQLVLALANGAGFAGAMTIANLLIVERRPKVEWDQRFSWLETVLSVGQCGALILAAWLSGLHPHTGLLIGAMVPAAAIPLALLLIPRMPVAVGPGRSSATSSAAAGAPPDARPAGAAHALRSAGHVGEWGPASPSRMHHVHHRGLPFSGIARLFRGGFGWMLAAWIPAYAGSAVVFSLYPVLFQHSFGVSPQTSALAFALIVFVSLPLYIIAGRVSRRHGPAAVMVAAFAARVTLLAALAALAVAGHVPAVLPLAMFGGILFAWSFLSVASPGLTGDLMPNAEGDAQGLLSASSGLAGLLGSVLGGLVAGRWGYPLALGLAAVSTAAGMVIFATRTLRSHRGV